VIEPPEHLVPPGTEPDIQGQDSRFGFQPAALPPAHSHLPPASLAPLSHTPATVQQRSVVDPQLHQPQATTQKQIQSHTAARSHCQQVAPCPSDDGNGSGLDEFDSESDTESDTERVSDSEESSETDGVEDMELEYRGDSGAEVGPGDQNGDRHHNNNVNDTDETNDFYDSHKIYDSNDIHDTDRLGKYLKPTCNLFLIS
jgi:hypothetical protein